jgi:hypothetical protein
MPVGEVLNALAWHIAVAYPEFICTPHRQVWRADGVALIPLLPAQGNGVDHDERRDA